MRVTDIVRTKRGRFSIYLDGEFFCVLHADVFALSSLSVDAQVDESYIEDLRMQSEGRIARERALRLLGQRAYTGQGLYRKLCEKADERAAAQAVARMAELGLVDDEDYARRYAAECMENKGFSHRRVEQELIRRGVDRAVVEAVLGELDEDPESAIANIICKKYLHLLGDERGEQRTVGALRRLGYSYGDIRTAMDHLREDEAYYETQ